MDGTAPHPGLPKRGSRREGTIPYCLSWGLPVLFHLLVSLGGCAAQGLPQRAGGLPYNEAVQISLVVAQTRAQFPELSARNLRHRPRSLPPAGKRVAVVHVLQGEGVAVQPGIQTGRPSLVKLKVFLQKPGYDAGRIEIAVDGRREETWPIVAHDQRGDPEGAFEFLYVLVTPAGAVRYLALVGGSYRERGRKFFAFEGTLIVPGKGPRAAAWKLAYKINFGFRFAVRPEHEPLLAQARRLFRGFAGQVKELEGLQRRIEAARKKGATSTAAGAKPSPLPNEFNQRRAALQKALFRYYRLRERIAASFGRFAASNFYRWLPPARQRQYFAAWQKGTGHHPEIDRLTRRARPFMKNPASLDAVRAKAMGQVRRWRNVEKDPFSTTRKR